MHFYEVTVHGLCAVAYCECLSADVVDCVVNYSGLTPGEYSCTAHGSSVHQQYRY